MGRQATVGYRRILIMETTQKFQKDRKINWYRCQVDPKVMSELMKCSDWQGFKQAGGHFALWVTTGVVTYLAFRQVSGANWYWSVPVLLAALFVHGTIGSFLGGTACHELSHKTPFKTKPVNEFFLKLFAFFGWWDQVWFRPSHIRHHQVTTHNDYDGEVILPQQMSLKDWKFWLSLFAWNPQGTWNAFKVYYKRATGKLDNDWFEFVMPESNKEIRRQHRNWARFTLIGHWVLAATFLATGHWFLIFLFNIGSHYCGWLGFLAGMPQHYGLTPNVPDHRLCCRTYLTRGVTAFLYWNMNYHIEHHMFPAVPFFNLPKLHKLIKDDMPPAPQSLRATWQGMLAIHRQMQTNPQYCYAPPLPQTHAGGRAEDALLEREAALAT